MEQNQWEEFLRHQTEETFSPVYDHTREIAYAVCWRRLRGDADLVDDAVQGAYARLLAWVRTGEYYNSPTEYQTAESAVSRFAWLEADRLRQRRRRDPEVPMDPNDFPNTSVGESGREKILEAETVHHLRELLLELDDFDRSCVELHYFDGMTHREIGLLTGKPQPTISTRIRRAIESLKPKAKARGMQELLSVLALAATSSAFAASSSSIPAASTVFLTASANAATMSASLGVGAGASKAAVGTSTEFLSKGMLALGCGVSFLGLIIFVIVVGFGGYFFSFKQTPGNQQPMTISQTVPAQTPVPTLTTSEDIELAVVKVKNETLLNELKSQAVEEVTEGATLSANACCFLFQGVVLDENSNPVSGASIQAISFIDGKFESTPVVESATSDSAGRFEVSVQDEEIAFAVIKANGFAREGVILTTGSKRFEHSKLGKIPNIEKTITLKEAAHIAGKVTFNNGAPVSNAKITINNRNDDQVIEKLTELSGIHQSDIISDQKGEYLISNLSAGEIELYVEYNAVSYGPFITTAPIENFRIVIGGDRSNDFKTVSGRVTDQNNQPADQVTVVWTPFYNSRASHSTMVDQNGEFSLQGIPQSEGIIMAVIGDNVLAQKHLEADQSENIILQITKPSRYKIAGEVYDPEGNLVEDFCAYEDNTSTYRAFPENGKGKFITKDYYLNQSVRIKVISDNHGTITRTVKIKENKTNEQLEKFYLLGTGKVIGRVVVGSKPVEGAVITYTGVQNNPWRQGEDADELITFTTGPDGTFEFDNLPGGVNTFKVEAEGFLKRGLSTAVFNDEISDAGDVDLSTGSSVVITLVDALTNQPLVGKELEIDPTWGTWFNDAEHKVQYTDQNGKVVFENLYTSDHYVFLMDYGIRAFRRVEPNTTHALDLKISNSQVFGNVTLYGKPSYSKVDFKRVQQTWEITSFAMSHHSTGKYSINHLPVGEWTVVAATINEPKLQKTDTLVVQKNQNTEFNVEYSGNEVSGIVLTSSNEPAIDAEVKVELPNSDTLRFMCDSNGNFTIPHLPKGAYQLIASYNSSNGLQSGYAKISVEENEVTPFVEIKLEEVDTGTLISYAVRMTDGGPVPLAWVKMKSVNQENPVVKEVRGGRDEEGKVVIENIKTGVYDVEVSDWGYSIHTHQIEIKSGEETVLEDIMFEAGAIRWTLKDVDGLPLVNVKATLESVDPGSPTTHQEVYTNTDGTAIFRGLYQGAYKTVHTSEHGTAENSFNVTAREVSGGESTVE